MDKIARTQFGANRVEPHPQYRALTRALAGFVCLCVVAAGFVFVAEVGIPSAFAAKSTVEVKKPWPRTKKQKQRVAEIQATAKAAANLRFALFVLSKAQYEEAQRILAAAIDAARHPAPPPPPPVVHATGHINWDGIAKCETGGNWQMHGSRYSGGLGFANTTWDGFGGREFASNAGLASRDQQIKVAERVYARYGLSGWGCRRFG